MLSVTIGEVRTRVGVRACGYEPGTKGNIQFADRNVLETAVADANGCMAGDGPTNVAAGGLQLISAVQTAGSFPAQISVPTSAKLGDRLVCANATAAGYALNCATFEVIAPKSSGGGGGGRDSLALTGFAVGILLAVALALIVFGRAMLSASRARRRSLIVTGVALRERTAAPR